MGQGHALAQQYCALEQGERPGTGPGPCSHAGFGLGLLTRAPDWGWGIQEARPPGVGVGGLVLRIQLAGCGWDVPVPPPGLAQGRAGSLLHHVPGARGGRTVAKQQRQIGRSEGLSCPLS